MSPRTGGAQRGLSLIEVLVTLVIAAIGLMGLAALQARTLSMQVDSESRRVAATLLAQLRERVTANQEGFATNSANRYIRTLNPGDPIVAPPPCANPNACVATTEVPDQQLELWLNEVRRQLPQPAVQMAPTNPGSWTAFTVTLGWIEPNAKAVAPDRACDGITSVRNNPAYRCLTVTFFPG